MFRIFHSTYVAIFRRYPVLGRIAVVAVLGELLFASLNNYALSFYVLYDLGQPGLTLAVLVSTFLIVEMLLKLPFGHLSDRYGRRLFASVGLAVCALTPAAILAIPAEVFILTPALIYAVLMPLRVVDGAGAAALWPPLFAAVPDTVPSEKRGVAMSVVNMSYLAGVALGPALAGLAMKLWRAHGAGEEWVSKAPFAMAAAAALIGALAARTLPARGHAGEAEETPDDAESPPARLVAVVMVITFGEMLGVATLGPYLAPYVREVTHMDRSTVGLLLLVLFIPAGLLGIPIGHLTDRWPRGLVVKSALWLAAIGLCLVPLGAYRSVVTLLLAGVVVLMGFLFGVPAWLALITDLAPARQRGRMMGLMATAQGLGAVLGPLLGGYLWDLGEKGHHYPWYASAAALTLAAVTALCCIRGPWAGKRGRSGEPPRVSV
jgi:DHA1 family multidrug resistance protein-like MFS transporter